MEDDGIAERLAAIEARLSALETQHQQAERSSNRSSGSGQDSAASGDGATGASEDTFWVLDGLRSRFEGTGAVTYAGSVTVAEGSADWQIGATTDQVMSIDWAESAGAIAALGHPIRLTLLHAVLGGAHTVAELSAVEGMGSTGQLYHHLGQLSSHGWLTTTGRGSYVVPATRIVPLMVIITAARRMP